MNIGDEYANFFNEIMALVMVGLGEGLKIGYNSMKEMNITINSG